MSRPTPGLHDELLTIPRSAEILGTSRDTVRRMISRGELKAVRFGRNIRIRPHDLEKALKPVTTYRGGDRVA
ncbi:helix-turn-helix domain-containing protein [Georgenia sp. Z1344]|uniref:helix-turn-helix domain-containing protein n=1 Tax=Georgenia sp. Z1344 TaxID=3416706 RepID=UPI003CECE80C